MRVFYFYHMLDYIIVGFGLSGLSFAEQLRKRNKSFVILDKGVENSSVIAGGMYNPVILKRFTLSWNATEQLAYSMPFYKEVEKLLNASFLQPFSVRRIFSSVDDQNNWVVASDQPNLAPYMNAQFISDDNKNIQVNHHYGEVLHAGRLLVTNLLDAYKLYLKAKDQFQYEIFNYDALKHEHDGVTYKNLKAKSIVFAEGFGLKNNPFFNKLPLVGNKGETLVIHAPKLQLSHIVKSGIFLIPLGNDQYFVGATYNRIDKDWETSEAGKEALLDKLTSIINCDYRVINHTAGIRPTTGDRRPLLGRHPGYPNFYVLNGMGTRGVMVAPLMSQKLYDFIENKTPLDGEIAIDRFKKWIRS